MNGSGPGPGGPVSATFPQCPQCKMFHPQIPLNQPCPLAPQKTNEGQVIDTANFMNQLKIIIVDQIKKRNVKDHQKLFGNVILEVTKFLENYKE